MTPRDDMHARLTAARENRARSNSALTLALREAQTHNAADLALALADAKSRRGARTAKLAAISPAAAVIRRYW